MNWDQELGQKKRFEKIEKLYTFVAEIRFKISHSFKEIFVSIFPLEDIFQLFVGLDLCNVVLSF